MAEEIKELIEKIQEEGVRAAESKARAIEEEARQQARNIIDRAKTEAKKTLEDARNNIARMEDSARTSLGQAARDVIIGLKKEIMAILNKLALLHVRKALTPDETAKVILTLAKECRAKEKSDIVVTVKKEDAEKIGSVLLAELSEEMKKGLTIKPSEDVHGGFTISYDHGKSYYDFTDKALAEYIGTYVKPKLFEILKDID